MMPDASAFARPVLQPRFTVARLSALDAVPETPAGATGRALLMAAWYELCDGAIECLDIYFRSGHVVTDLIALRLRGPIAEATQERGRWTHAFALDDVAVVRGIGFGRMR